MKIRVFLLRYPSIAQESMHDCGFEIRPLIFALDDMHVALVSGTCRNAFRESCEEKSRSTA
jgi:hypothetical protein